MRVVLLQGLPYKIYYDNEGKIWQVSFIKDDCIVQYNGNNIIAHKDTILLKNLLTDEIKLIADEVEFKSNYFKIDDRFGWYQCNDKNKTLLNISNLFHNIISVEKDFDEKKLVITTKNKVIELNYESRNMLNKEYNDIRQFMSLLMKFKARKSNGKN